MNAKLVEHLQSQLANVTPKPADEHEALSQRLRERIGNERATVVIEYAKRLQAGMRLDFLRAAQTLKPDQAVEEAPSRKTWNDTVNAPSGKPQRKREKAGVIAPRSTEILITEGYFKVQNELADELIAVMPSPVLKAYIYASRVADQMGLFWVSGETIAEKIGSKGRNRRRHGVRVINRLLECDLIRKIERGHQGGKANVYQLTPLDVLDWPKTRELLGQPLNGSGLTDQ